MNNSSTAPNNNSDQIVTSTSPKPPKPEDKPFEIFIKDEFIPCLKEALTNSGFPPNEIVLKNGERPVTGDECWMVVGEIFNGRRFWLCFDNNKITSNKTVALAEQGSSPSVLESFLIDEKKTTKALLLSRLLQRLNGQKWLGAN